MASSVASRQIACRDHDDVIVRKEIERRGVLGARHQGERAGFRDRGEGMAEGIEVASCGGPCGDLDRRRIPRHGGKPRVIADTQGRGQIGVAQEASRFGRAPQAASATSATVASASSAWRPKSASRSAPVDLRTHRDDAAGGARKPVLDRRATRGLPAADAKRAAYRRQNVIASAGHDPGLRLARARQRAWKVGPWGLGKSRCDVQPEPKGREDKNPLPRPKRASAHIATRVAVR